MDTTLNDQAVSRRAVWAGRIVSVLPALFMLFDGVIHTMKIPAVVEGFAKLGYPISVAVTLGIIEIVCAILYLIPRTSVLGAVLLTGYLGGAIASNVRIQAPLLGYVLFPVYVALFLWGGVWLRDRRVREVLPVVR
jgi:uncharacterized membrane protein YphA (DoxX/SURF4 family)